MLQGDFFTFCTSLPMLELKAVGELSCVKHYGEGELVYSAGDPSNELFIINRGLVEITPEPTLPGGSTVLCRGDIFGERLEQIHHSSRRRLVENHRSTGRSLPVAYGPNGRIPAASDPLPARAEH